MDFYVSLISQVGPWIGGALVGVSAFILKNRRSLLAYHVTHQRIGVSAEDDVHGKVEVRYRGNVVQNLYLSTVEIKNRSIRDLENLDIKAYRGSDRMAILTEQTHIRGTLDIVDLTKEYFDRIVADAEWEREIREAGAEEDEENKKRLDSDWRFRHGQRHYVVPVLNRGQTIELTYLTTAAPDMTPTVYVTCQTKGVRIKEKSFPLPVSHFWGVPMPHAALSGVVVGTIIVLILMTQLQQVWLAATISFLLGVLATVPGALAVKTYEWLRRTLVG